MKKGFVIRFSSDGLRRLAEGTKRATVLRATQAIHISAGEEVTAKAVGLDARLPVRVDELVQMPHLGALPVAAGRLGLGLADFTTLPDWTSYQHAAGRGVPGAAALVVLTPTGPVVGTIPDRVVRRRTPDSVHGRAWHRVTDTLPIHAADQVHEGDRAQLQARIKAAIEAEYPHDDEIELLEPVIEALLHSGRCGPARLGKPHRRRLGAQFTGAQDWLTAHGLLGSAGAERTWTRDLLAGLRINQDDQQPSEQ